MKIVWVCLKCNWVVTSDSAQHHCMDFCQCRECGMDLEEYHCRTAFKSLQNFMILAKFENSKWRRARK